MQAITIVIGAVFKSSFKSIIAGGTKQSACIDNAMKQCVLRRKPALSFKRLTQDNLIIKRWNKLALQVPSLAGRIAAIEASRNGLQKEINRPIVKLENNYTSLRSIMQGPPVILAQKTKANAQTTDIISSVTRPMPAGTPIVTKAVLDKSAEEAGNVRTRCSNKMIGFGGAIPSKLPTTNKPGNNFQKAFQNLGLNTKKLEKVTRKNSKWALLKFPEAAETLDNQMRASVLLNLFSRKYQHAIALPVSSFSKYKYVSSMQSAPASRTAGNAQLLKDATAEARINTRSVSLPPLNFMVNTLKSVTKQVVLFAKACPWTLATAAIRRTFKLIKASLISLHTTYTPFPATIAGLKVATVTLVSKSIRLVISDLAAAAMPRMTNRQTASNPFDAIWESVKAVHPPITNFKTTNEFWDKKSKAKLEVKLVPNTLAMEQPRIANTRTLEHKTQNNHFIINIQANPSQDTRSIADEVIQRIREQFSDALYDTHIAFP